MTTGYICDRCGETFTDGGKWLQGGYHGSTAIMHWWDLCPDCMDSFAGWMERGQIADMSEKSADCVRDGDAVSDIHESAREHSLESESMREQSESVRERRYESQDVTGSAERVTKTPELLHDTREKLEADMREYFSYWIGGTSRTQAAIIGWLDRQAAIAKKECADFWQEIAEDRDRAQMKCAELTAERDHWKDAFEDSERLRLELIEELEKRDKGIRRLKQRRGELMEQVRKLQDDAARARREA